MYFLLGIFWAIVIGLIVSTSSWQVAMGNKKPSWDKYNKPGPPNPPGAA